MFAGYMRKFGEMVSGVACCKFTEKGAFVDSQNVQNDSQNVQSDSQIVQ